MSGRYFTRALPRGLCFLLFLVSPTVLPADGLVWLSGQVRADGSIAASSEIALPFQATAETLRAFRALGAHDHPVIEPARDFLSIHDRSLTEAIARRVIDTAEAGGDPTAAVNLLLDRQNADGGFGERPGLDSTVVDTAFALEALAGVRLAGTEAVGLAAGYLLGLQSSDGGWAEGTDVSSVYLTALSMHALWRARNDSAVTGALDRAQAYLLAQRQGAAWRELQETAVALLALLPRRTQREEYTQSVAALRDRRSADGSWDGSAYVTALALRALVLSQNPHANPDLGTIGGRVLDGDSGFPMEGATATLGGTAASATVTGSDGVFGFADLPAGEYLLELTAGGYTGLTTVISLSAGELIDLGDLLVLADSQGDTGTVRGVVSDARNAEPLSGTSVTVGNLGALSGPDGTYQITNVPAGVVTVRADHPDYAAMSASGKLAAGAVLMFSPRLEPGGEGEPAGSTIGGTVLDGASGEPLEGVEVLLAGCGDAVAITGADGRYELSTDAACTATVTLSRTGYDSVSRTITLFGGSYVQFAVTLYPATTTPPDANTTTVTGVVLDASTSRPLGGVEIIASPDGLAGKTLSDNDGRFTFSGISEPELPLSFHAAGYGSVKTVLIVEPVGHVDVGQIRLRPQGTGTLVPDLAVRIVAKTAPFSDPHDYRAAASLEVEVRNSGSRPVSGGFDVVAFHDANANGRFDAVTEPLLGELFWPDDLGPETSFAVDIPVAGRLPFRDAPVTVAADTATRVVEASVGNNFDTTASLCRSGRPAGVFDPVLQWHWRGPAAGPARGVLGPPMVGQFSDDNGDGKIGQDDIPDLVFVDSSAALNIVSGSDGSPILRRTDLPLSWLGSVSLGDIDRDGLFEIIVPDRNNRSELFALEHNGSIKWRSSTGPSHNGSFRTPRDGVAIADLDGDGEPEIVHGSRVFSADGTLLWTGNKDGGGYRNYGFLPLAADIDLDGRQEVIAGRSVYDHAGNLVWHAGRLVSDGFNALGNFDDDQYPEIVLVASGRVHLLEHDGSLTWGPVSLPGGGQGGPPTVADFDNDGRPEIGVAGYSRYTVFDSDGSVLWAQSVKDYSSARTGSSVFDFDNDGRAEVLYNDEDYFFVFDGSDGRILLKMPNGSGTTLEYPLVANVDDDDSPEIVLPSSNNAYGTMGLRVFESATGAWVPTRRLWNQHSYHVGNIDEDGSIPVNEPPSWLSHNTYRLNAFLERDPLDSADLTVGGFSLIDNGAGEPLTAIVRAGNGGLVSPSGAVDIALYQGDNAASRLLLVSATVEGLAPDAYRDLRIDGVLPEGASPLVAVINAGRQVRECDYSNNEASIPVSVVPAGRIEVATDRRRYLAGVPVALTSGTTNIGSFTSDFRVRLRIEDAAGNTVLEFAEAAVPALAPGATLPTDDLWHTRGVYTGDYVLRGLLYTAEGNLLDEDTAQFHIGAANALIDGTIATDRVEYSAWDRVTLTSLVRNTTSSAIQPPTVAQITVFDPQGTAIGSFLHDVPELVPAGSIELADVLRLADAAPGVHLARLEVEDPVAGTSLDVDETSFVVVRHASQGLAGTVTAALPRIYPGDPNSCTDRVQNLAAQPLADVTVHHRLVSFDAETVVGAAGWPAEFAAGDVFQRVVPVDTADLPPGGYSCLLQATVDGITVDLDSASFAVLEPPVHLEAELAIGDRGRLLVLLDDGVDMRDPHGPGEAPPLHEQRAFIEDLFDRNGISRVIVTTADEFARQLRTGAYSTYLLLSEQQKLAEAVTAELREAVFAGEGLIEVGSHDERNGRIDEALGITYKGRLPDTEGFQPAPAELALREGARFAISEKGLKVRADAATVEAIYSDPDVSAPPDPDIAVTSNTYGGGRSVYGGFDFLVQAAAARDATPYEALLVDAIEFAQPDDYLHAGRAVPVTLRLTNQGVAAAGLVVLHLPAGVTAVDVAGGEIAADGTPVWPFDAAEHEVVTSTTWLVFPAGGTEYRLEADVLTGVDSDLALHATVGLDLRTAAAADADELGISLGALAGDKTYRQLAGSFAKAQADLSAGMPEHAIRFLAKTADGLGSIGTPQADELRRQVARLVRQTEMQIH